MRFGRTLASSTYGPWKDKYIDYTKLKKLLRDDGSAPSSPSTRSEDEWTEDDESRFVNELVNVQLEKVHASHKETYEKLRERTAQCEAQLDPVAVAESSEHTPQTTSEGTESNEGADDTSKSISNGKNKKAIPSEGEKTRIMKDVLKELDQITKETNELEKYSRINYTGFLKAAKKHDRKRGTSYRVRPLLQVRLSALAFNKEDYGPLLFRLSAMYNFIRQRLEDGASRSKSFADARQGKDEYVSEKFWVHPENLLEVKTVLLRRLPVLVYNPQTSKVADGSQPDPSITSIYFDSPDFALYTRKIEEGEASSLRLRWYGQLNERPEIFVERKTVNDDGSSSDARFPIKDKYVQRYINDEYHMEKQLQKIGDRVGQDSAEYTDMNTTVDEIQQFIKTRRLQPVLRANYSRTAFQIPGDDRVRVSLDTDLAFIREDALDERPCRDPDSWHRTDIDNNKLQYPFTSIRKGEVSRFPFALLEIKMRNNNTRKTEWVQDLMNSHLVKRAPRFSKFAHGVASLFEDYVNTFPFWLSDMETDIRREPLQAFEEEQAKKQKEADDEFAVGSLLKSYGSFGDKSRSHKDIVSPAGSPATIRAGQTPSNLEGRMHSDAGIRHVAPTQLEETAEEPDDDETGQQAHNMERSFLPGRLMGALATSFSTSKYAQSKRSKLPAGVTKPEIWIKDQGEVKVEGKVWMANQRTFVKWAHVTVLLTSLSLGLYNAAGKHNGVAEYLGVIYTVVGVLTALWGYGIYMYRIQLTQRRSGKDFDFMLGPLFVCGGLVVALILNFAFKYQAALDDRRRHRYPSPGLNDTQSAPWQIVL